MACEPGRRRFFATVAEVAGCSADELEGVYRQARDTEADAIDEAALEGTSIAMLALMRQLEYPIPIQYAYGLPREGSHLRYSPKGCTVEVCRCIRPLVGYAAVYRRLSELPGALERLQAKVAPGSQAGTAQL